MDEMDELDEMDEVDGDFRSIQWQMNPECAALPGDAGHADSSPVHQSDMFDNGKTQSRAALLSAAIRIDTVETFEQTWQMFGLDTTSCIRNEDGRLLVV